MKHTFKPLKKEEVNTRASVYKIIYYSITSIGIILQGVFHSTITDPK